VARSRSVQKSVDPYTDSSGGWPIPELNAGMLTRDIGSSGLRQYAGWVREEFLRALLGREAQRVYREMSDNSPVVGAVLFAITQAMRKVEWREEPASDAPEAAEAAAFARSLRFDMSHPWEDHVVEALSMLTYGFAPHEIVYKRRLGPKGSATQQNDASSAYNDGKIGIRRLPLRGQETILKWFFDQNGQVMGMTQQPWIGALIDLPIEKMLLYRPTQHKNNPEGRSILRTAYRPYYFMKRIEELEAILFERMGGLPLVRVPNALLEAAKANEPGAAATLAAYKQLAMNVRADEQMGIVMPSDTYKDAAGSPTAHRMYDFELKTPDTSALRVDSDKVIHRYNVDILKSVLADFIDLGHQARGTQNLAISKVDMFYTAIEGWLKSMGSVQNRYLLPRVWALNGMDLNLLPQYAPDLPMRIDLDVFGKFILALAQSGMALFPDKDLENYIRGAAGMPDVAEEQAYDPTSTSGDDIYNLISRRGQQPGLADVGPGPMAGPGAITGAAAAAKHVLGLAALTKRRLDLAAQRPYGIRDFDPASDPYDIEKLTRAELDAAASAARAPVSPSQRTAGNYPKGHVNLHGLSFSIENQRGSVRSGIGKDGLTWGAVLPAHYGYVRRAAPGADGAALDVYLGPEPDSQTVFMIDQLDPDTGKFDEHKAMVGWSNLHDALNTYRQAFSDGRGDERVGAVHRVSIDGFKSWLKGGDLQSPVGSVVGKNHLNGSARLTNGHA
jgi:hypothetical protein